MKTTIAIAAWGFVWRAAYRLQIIAGHVAAYAYHAQCKIITADTRKRRRPLD